jgi:hypothetical protein
MLTVIGFTVVRRGAYRWFVGRGMKGDHLEDLGFDRILLK